MIYGGKAHSFMTISVPIPNLNTSQTLALAFGIQGICAAYCSFDLQSQ